MKELEQFNLLIFDDSGNGEAGNSGEGTENNEPKTISFENQSELDKWHETKVQKTLEKARGKWEVETQSKVDEAIKQALEREKLTEKERLALENKEKEQAFIRQQEELSKRELRLDALDLLNEKNLPKELLGALDFSSKEALNKSVEEVSNVFTSLVTKGIEEGVKERLAKSSHTPTGGETGGGSMTFDEFAKLKTWEQADIARKQPELFKQLTGGI